MSKFSSEKTLLTALDIPGQKSATVTSISSSTSAALLVAAQATPDAEKRVTVTVTNLDDTNWIGLTVVQHDASAPTVDATLTTSNDAQFMIAPKGQMQIVIAGDKKVYSTSSASTVVTHAIAMAE